MTIEKLLNLSIDQLEAMSYEELYKHLEQYLPQTRPELVQQQPSFKANRRIDKNSSKQDKAKAILEQYGFKNLFK